MLEGYDCQLLYCVIAVVEALQDIQRDGFVVSYSV